MCNCGGRGEAVGSAGAPLRWRRCAALEDLVDDRAPLTLALSLSASRTPTQNDRAYASVVGLGSAAALTKQTLRL